MNERATDTLTPSVMCLQYYRERILGIAPGTPFGIEERGRVRQAVMAGIAVSTEIDPVRHGDLAERIEAKPGRRYLRSGDVVYVTGDDPTVISVFRILLDPMSFGYLVLAPCVAVYAEKVLGIDVARHGLGETLAKRTRTMIAADLLQSEDCGTGFRGNRLPKPGVMAVTFRRIRERIFTTVGGSGKCTIVRSVRVQGGPLGLYEPMNAWRVA